MVQNQPIKQSFTLIELLLSMALLSILATLLIGNYLTTLKRGRDQQRKNDLSQIQKALELYYEDHATYPTFTVTDKSKFCTSQNCSVIGETVYMVKIPKDPSSSFTYRYESSDGTYYYLYSYIESDKDVGANVNKNGYTNDERCDSAKATLKCRYYIGSPNAVPLTPY